MISADRLARCCTVCAVLLAAAIGCERDEPSGEASPTGEPTSALTSGVGAPTADAAVTDAATDAPDAATAPEPAPLGRAPSWGERTKWDGTLKEQNELLFKQLRYVHDLSDEQLAAVQAVFDGSKRLGQGNPQITKHPVSPADCQARLAEQGVDYDNAKFLRICGARFMAPLYDPKQGTPEDAEVCIDQFEFPNIPCVFPVTWVTAREAVELCRAEGKRLCDAHEWEGACAGQLRPPDYDFKRIEGMKPKDARKRLRANHNLRENKSPVWAYGPEHKKGVCATASRKSKECGVGWRKCGTNTFPAGYFPSCRSPLAVYDLHGNAAEHMNLPLQASQMASAPDTPYGYTEMKGSWFIFDRFHAHEDHCRWRAPDWHGTRVMNKRSHRNYHLGFRCCKDVH